MSMHMQTITQARRRNNIYGDRGDYVITGFLAAGGVGAMYCPGSAELLGTTSPPPSDAPLNTPSILIGRSEATLYVVSVSRHVNRRDPVPTLSDDLRGRLSAVGDLLGATPLFAVAREFSQKVRFYRLDGAKAGCL
jgi:hypothetical protein